MLAKLRNVDLRKVWKNETSDFNTWLSKESNLKELGFEIGMKLELIRREGYAGKYRVDLVAKNTINDEIVIIENQLERTNHGHLGQLLTYSSHYEAKNIIWIVKSLRIEHERAIEWLNHNLGNDIKIFLVKIEVFRIGESLPAPKFTVISKPYGWTNNLFREEMDIEPIPTELIDYEKIKKAITKESLIVFLDKFIEVDRTYIKKELLDSYNKFNKLDCDFYRQHTHQFRKDLISWSKMNNLVVNKDYQNDHFKGYHKSGGIEYISFNK